MKTYKDKQHAALDAAGKGVPVDLFLPEFGTELLDVLVHKSYVYVTKEDRPRVMLDLQGARCLLDYEGLWNDGRLLGR